MRKSILTIIIVAAMLLGTSHVVRANTMRSAVEMIDFDIHDVNLSYANGVMHITGANGMVVKVYNLAGIMVKTFLVEGQDKRISLPLSDGIYIIKVGSSYTRKITVNRR